MGSSCQTCGMRHAKFYPRGWQFTRAMITRGHMDLSIALPDLRICHLVRFGEPAGNLRHETLRHSRSSHTLTHMPVNPLLIGRSTRLHVNHATSTSKSSAAARDVLPGGLSRFRSLVVVESPAKAKKIQKYLGTDFTASLYGFCSTCFLLSTVLPTHDCLCSSRQTCISPLNVHRHPCTRRTDASDKEEVSEPYAYRSWRAMVMYGTSCRSQARLTRKTISS